MAAVQAKRGEVLNSTMPIGDVLRLCHAWFLVRSPPEFP